MRTSRGSRNESIFVGFVESGIDATTVRATKIPDLDDTINVKEKEGISGRCWNDKT